MQTKSMDFIVGIVFVLGMAILGYATIFTGEFFSGTKKYYVVNFPKVYGLKTGSEVRCEGKKVGKVKSLKLVKEKVQSVIEVDDNVDIYWANAKVSVTPFSPLGGRIVEITRGTPTEDGKAREPTTYLGEGRFEGGEVIDGEAEGELLSALTELIQENRANVDSIISNIEDASGRLNQSDNLIGKVLTDKEFAQKIDDIAGHLKEASSSIQNITARIDNGDGIIGDATIKDSRLQKGVNRVLDNGGDALDEFRKVGESMNKGDGLANVLLNEEQFANDWRQTSRNVRSVTGKFDQNKGIMRLVTEDEVYDNLESISKDVREVAAKVNDQEAGPLGVLVGDKAAGENLDRTIENLATTSDKLNSKEDGVLGVLISDEELGQTTRQVFNEAGRVIKEFRDSTEDIREQAPVSAFLGTVFAAF